VKSVFLLLTIVLTCCSTVSENDFSGSGTTLTVLSGGNLLDGTGAPVRSNVDIFLVDDQIEAIVNSGERAIPSGAITIDVREKWVIPGLIDSHVHYKPWMAELFLYHGVTSVFELGNTTEVALRQRETIRQGEAPGPRLFVTGEALRGAGASESGIGEGRRRGILSSAEEVRTYTHELLDQGIDAIKVNVRMPFEWIRIVTELAHADNKPVVAHLSTPVHEAIEAGLDALIHPYTIDLSTLHDPVKIEFIKKNMPLYVQRKEYYPYYLLEPDRYAGLISQMIDKGVFFNPTFGAQFRGIYPEREEFEKYDSLFLDHLSQKLGYLVFPIKTKLLPFFERLRFYPIDSELRRKQEIGLENVAEFMRQFSAGGGKMVAGTDTSSIGIPGIRLHRELQLWVARGIVPMEALRAATQFPAQLFRLSHLGTVEVGKQADLLVLNGNPLEDIRLLGAIDQVFLNGKPVQRELNPSLLTSLANER